MKPEPRIAQGAAIAVSACLLGEPVRYDGDHRRNGYVAGILSRLFPLVPFCPEMEIGLGSPRDPIGLVSGPQERRAIQSGSGGDVTTALRGCGLRAIDGGLPVVCGFIFKSRSPSCAVSSAPVWNMEGGARQQTTAAGIYAEAVMTAAPGMPVIEDTDLADIAAREKFLRDAAEYARAKNTGGA